MSDLKRIAQAVVNRDDAWEKAIAANGQELVEPPEYERLEDIPEAIFEIVADALNDRIEEVREWLGR